MLDDEDAFTKITGEVTIFTLHESDNGAFSGYETVYWTTAGNCSASDTIAGINNGTILASNYSGVATSMTLLHLQPTVYTLCYDWDGTGSAVYKLQGQVTLDLLGADRLSRFAAMPLQMC